MRRIECGEKLDVHKGMVALVLMQIEISVFIMQVMLAIRNSTIHFVFSLFVAISNAETGGSTNPCNEIYAGVKPFSEPESVVLSEFIKSFDNIKLYLSFHSYGNMLLFPYVSTWDSEFQF